MSVVEAVPHGPARRRWWRPALGVLAALLILAGLYLPAAWPQSQVYGRIVTHGPAGELLIALTFDDGPSDPATSALLDVLREKDARATFFVVGHNAERAPETVRRIAAEGHAIGNHSYRHRKRDALLDPRYRDVARAQSAIAAATGFRPTLYRSPNGFHTPWQLRAVRAAGLTAVHWNVQTYDWENPAPERIVTRVLDGLEPGAIVLLHDGDDTQQGTDRAPTVQAVAMLIDVLRARGYRLVTVPELLGLPDRLP